MADKLFKEYSVDSDGVNVGVKIVYKEGEFVKSYVLNIPEYGSGTKALMDSLKRVIIMDGNVKA